MRARKRFGQHFLTDTSVLDAMSNAINLHSADRVFEIGPGQGALTDVLFDQVDSQGHYLAVEIDRDLIPWLQARFSSLQLVNADILKLDLASALSASQNWRVVGNLPYNVSSAILMKLTEQALAHTGSIQDIHVMVQKEMALRVAASPGSKAWGRLSVMVQLLWQVEYLFDVGPESFSPPPKVDSSVLRLWPQESLPDAELVRRVDRVVRLAFAARRKRLSNALKSLNIDWSSCSVDPQVRADDVTIDEFVELSGLATPEQQAS